jgi:H+/Na+-translocating ferredoxin:NAD+ oxidoreductase subunit G
MGEMIKMVVVLTVLSVISGGGLKGLEEWAKPRIENNVMNMVKGPAIRAMLDSAENDPVADRFKIQDGDTERTVFVGVFGGKPNTVVIESQASGYGDKIGLVVGIDMVKETLAGIGVTTHKETPGLGGNAKDDPKFAAQFKGMTINKPIAVTDDGGEINALSGATITSRAVCKGTMLAVEKYKELQPQLTEKLKSMSN